MNKKKLIGILLIILLLLILFVPIPSGIYKDGGTRVYTALTYKIVKWHVILNPLEKPDVIDETTADLIINYKPKYFSKTSIYLFPESLKSLDDLYQIEKEKEGF